MSAWRRRAQKKKLGHLLLCDIRGEGRKIEDLVAELAHDGTGIETVTCHAEGVAGWHIASESANNRSQRHCQKVRTERNSREIERVCSQTWSERSTVRVKAGVTQRSRLTYPFQVRVHVHTWHQVQAA